LLRRSILASTAALVLLNGSWAQGEKRLPIIYVPLGGFRMSVGTSKGILLTAKVDKAGIVKLSDRPENRPASKKFMLGRREHWMDFIAPRAQRTLYLTGIGLGETTLTLTDMDGTTEQFRVVVRRELALPPGVALRFQLPDKQPIARAIVDQQKVVRV